MNKCLIGIVLAVIFLSSCTPEEKTVSLKKTDLEMDVINDVLPGLIPLHPPVVLAPIEGESYEDYEKRLQEFYDEVDSVGKKIELVSRLNKLDSTFIEVFKHVKEFSLARHILNSPNKNRRIDSTMVRKMSAVKIILVEEPRMTQGAGLSDRYTLGQFTISRVGFNSDSTKAAFTYSMDNGSCFVDHSGIINAELKNGRWRLHKINGLVQ